jgi:hypothetical protein
MVKTQIRLGSSSTDLCISIRGLNYAGARGTRSKSSWLSSFRTLCIEVRVKSLWFVVQNCCDIQILLMKQSFIILTTKYRWIKTYYNRETYITCVHKIHGLYGKPVPGWKNNIRRYLI